jgi:hypothetical protein
MVDQRFCRSVNCCETSVGKMAVGFSGLSQLISSHNGNAVINPLGESIWGEFILLLVFYTLSSYLLSLGRLTCQLLGCWNGKRTLWTVSGHT